MELKEIEFLSLIRDLLREGETTDLSMILSGPLTIYNCYWLLIQKQKQNKKLLLAPVFCYLLV